MPLYSIISMRHVLYLGCGVHVLVNIMLTLVLLIMYAAIALPKLPEEPHQPVNFNFPERSFGQKKHEHCSFQGKWFSKWHWLHYDEAKDAIFCFICVHANSCSLAYVAM